MIQSILYRLKPYLKKLYNKFGSLPTPNNSGARDIEYSFIFANIPDGDGEALDLGVGNSYIGLVCARKGYNVLGIDLQDIKFNYLHHKFKFKQIKLANIDIKYYSLDLITNCSTIEHIGLKRYSNDIEIINEDLLAMRELSNRLTQKGIMLLTIPVGKDALFNPYHRVYGFQRLPELLCNFKIEKEEYWIKNIENQWVMVDKEIALNTETTRHYYGLGLFVLRSWRYDLKYVPSK